MQTIYIMWLRQIKKYFRSRARIIGSLGQPLLFLIVFGFGFGPIFAKAGAGNYMQFLAPGIIAMSIIFTSLFSGIEIIWDRQFGFLKETLVAPVSRLKIMFGRTLGGATVGLLQGILVLIIAIIAGFRPTLSLLPLGLLFMVLIAILFTSVGTAIASLMEDMQGFHLIMNFIIMPIFFLSGALFPLEGTAQGLRIVAKLNPLTYGVDGLRDTLTGIASFGLLTDFLVLVSVSIILLIVGSYLFSRIQV